MNGKTISMALLVAVAAGVLVSLTTQTAEVASGAIFLLGLGLILVSVGLFIKGVK